MAISHQVLSLGVINLNNGSGGSVKQKMKKTLALILVLIDVFTKEKKLIAI